MKCRGELEGQGIKKLHSDLSPGACGWSSSSRDVVAPLPSAHMLECLTLPPSLSQTIDPPPPPPPNCYISLSLAEAYFDGATLFERVHMVAIFQLSIWVKITIGGAALFSARVFDSLTSLTLLGLFYLFVFFFYSPFASTFRHGHLNCSLTMFIFRFTWLTCSSCAQTQVHTKDLWKTQWNTVNTLVSF